MAVRPGEENVATLFGDVHYFYGPPEAKPPHHRFDKGSYVYLFENANDRRARIEIANNAGTEDQDAFDGFLDSTRIRYSYNQQCLVSIVVDGVPGAPIDPSQWHLPTYDPRNENKYHYKLHSLDIYFWTQNDALQFVNGVRRVLPPSQVEVADEPGPPPSHSHSYHQSHDVNPLVQKLENAAISDPAHSSPQPPPQGAIIPSFAPPPTEPSHPHPHQGAGTSPQAFAPIPYNPAAPAAPEQIKHREKTPPPPDEDGHDPLAAAVVRDSHPAVAAPPYTPGYGAPTPFSPSLPPPPPAGNTGFPGPPMQHHPGLASPGIVSPLASPGLQSPGFPPPHSQFGHLHRASTMPASPGAALQSPYGTHFPGSPGFAPTPQLPPQQTAHVHHTPTPPQAQAVQSPGLPPHAQAVQSPDLPPGGYAQFNYANPGGSGSGGSVDYGIHQQLYRPTEHEHAVKYKPKVEGQTSKLGQNAERLERGVTGMLKKFEKKFG
ncbi:hypothetical protein F5B20DRAFT_551009 [Whalleya microplaca]|nr:hypothetical protein F5B20DRAFT_551009 [Whalleya microplaca]